MQLYEFGDYQTLPATVDVPAFKAYVKQVWENRHIFHQSQQWAEPSQTEEQTADLRKQGQAILKFDGPDIQARNYVGFIHYNGLNINLLPKIFQYSGFSTPVIFQHLLFYLSYVPGFSFPFAKQSLDSCNKGTPLQVCIHLFAAFTENTLASQAYLAYEEQQGSQAFMRGKLLANEYLRHHMARGQWQQLYTRHASLQYDNRFNQLIKHTARRLLSLASRETQPLLESILFMLQEVSEQDFSSADIKNISITRLYEDQQDILHMCRFFLANEQLCPQEQGGNNFSFLLPMERVFEYFVAGFIRQHFPEWNIMMQSKEYLAVRQGERFFQIINDIWMPQKGLVLDTKYKWLDSEPENLHKNISQADIYQMLAYAIGRNATQVHLLFPGKIPVVPAHTYEIAKGLGKEIVYLHVHQLPVIIADGTDLTQSSVADFLVPSLKEKLKSIADL